MADCYVPQWVCSLSLLISLLSPVLTFCTTTNIIYLISVYVIVPVTERAWPCRRRWLRLCRSAALCGTWLPARALFPKRCAILGCVVKSSWTVHSCVFFFLIFFERLPFLIHSSSSSSVVVRRSRTCRCATSTRSKPSSSSQVCERIRVLFCCTVLCVVFAVLCLCACVDYSHHLIWMSQENMWQGKLEKK